MMLGLQRKWGSQTGLRPRSPRAVDSDSPESDSVFEALAAPQLSLESLWPTRRIYDSRAIKGLARS
ncbi:MAG: hypothetical protein CO108_05425 [Deltaproteobacteria bacterium CG_4_9_14_3_um_filter_63_12]|nr:MAG: hypothetical protein COW42_05510 [Deltaproteobacteria bacterium CG17_big_fil_post_rev_8_21_14_2_50_63_7]PJB46662.1 MAG: hypothetical protein CO108_05425 [Deltaproteobacteria bacterium CG_4_9_14_3_um_filter_63_12]